MNRKNVVKLIFAAAVALTAALFSPTSSQAVVAGYVCSGTHNSSVYTGTGSTCANARSAVQAQGYFEADQYCSNVTYADGYCPRGYTVTSTCTYLGNGLYSESGYVAFGCRLCGYPGGPVCP